MTLDLFPTRAPRVLSYGGGLDSFAMLVEALRRGDRPDACTFMDVGDPDGKDPGEWPSTYRHMREVVLPLCEREAIPFHWLDGVNYPVRDARSLWEWMRARGQVPVKGNQRICTTIAKVERFERWLRDTYGAHREVEVWIGFDAGETERVAKDPNAGRVERRNGPLRRNRFPLVEWGLCRCRCAAAVRASGYPVPRKSACTFCCYNTRLDWQTLSRELPETFARVVELEASKPPTKAGARITIARFDGQKTAPGPRARGWYPSTDGSGRWFKSTPLPEYIGQSDKVKPVLPCEVCGAEVPETKEPGCSYADDEAAQ